MDAVFEFLAPIGLNETNFRIMLIAALLGMSIYMTLYGGMFSLANAGFMAIGAYTAVILTQQFSWDFLPAIIAATIMAGLVAIPVGWPVLRLNDIYLAIATIGFGEIIVVIVRNMNNLAELIYEDILNTTIPENFPVTGGATGIKGIPVFTETWHLALCVVIFGYFLYRMYRSRFGRALAAIRQDPNVAANLGINVVYYKNMAFIFGAMMAGCAGALYGHLNRIVVPEDYGFSRVVEILTYAVLGGTTTLFGPIIGGMFLEYLPEALRRMDFFTFLAELGDQINLDLTNKEANIRAIINGIILIVVIAYLPSGIASPDLWKNLGRRIRKRLGA